RREHALATQRGASLRARARRHAVTPVGLRPGSPYLTPYGTAVDERDLPRQLHPGEPGERREEPLLRLDVASHRVRRLDLEALDVLAGHVRLLLVGHSEPHLGGCAVGDLVPRVRSAEPRLDPPGVDG